MGTNAVQRGPTAETVSANVKRLRTRQNLGLRGLSKKLGGVGRAISHSAVDQIEKGTRRVDVDDLQALAAALDVTPATLLMPVTTREEWETPVDATGQPEGVTAQQLWAWLTAKRPPRMPAGDLFDANADEYLMWLIGAVPPGAITLTAGSADVVVTVGLTGDGEVTRGDG
jgi:transcriptional regulator with XRE-family HTH domain